MLALAWGPGAWGADADDRCTYRWTPPAALPGEPRSTCPGMSCTCRRGSAAACQGTCLRGHKQTYPGRCGGGGRWSLASCVSTGCGTGEHDHHGVSGCHSDSVVHRCGAGQHKDGRHSTLRCHADHPAGHCDGHHRCISGHDCRNGRCVLRQCSTGQHRHHGAGKCHGNHPAGHCHDADHPCGQGLSCARSRCRLGDCPSGRHRAGDGVSCHADHPPGHCDDDHKCGAGHTCIGGSCSLDDCPSGRHRAGDGVSCHADHPAGHCDGDHGCGAGHTCAGSACVPDAPGGCAAGQHAHGSACHADHPAGHCDRDHGCGAGRTCAGSACVPDAPGGCAAGQHAHGSACHADHPAGHCDGDHGCGAGRTCAGSACVPDAPDVCTAGQHAHGGACHADHPAGHCDGDHGCGAGRTCAGSACVPDVSDVCAAGQHAHGDACHADHPACPPNSSEATHAATERTCACDEGHADADPTDGELVCAAAPPVCPFGAKTEGCRCADGEHVHGPPDALDTQFESFVVRNHDIRNFCHATGLPHLDPGCAASGGTWGHGACVCPAGLAPGADGTSCVPDGCADGQHAHGDACHPNHPDCPANAGEATHTATERTCACDEGHADADPTDGELVCTAIPPEGCTAGQHAHGDACHADHPACPPNSSEATHAATERTCACDEGHADADPTDGELVCAAALPVCPFGAKTEGCRCADGEHVHGPPDALDTQFESFVVRNHDIRNFCHATGLPHLDPGCAASGGTWGHGTCSCPEGMEAGADGRSCACPDGDADPVSVPRASVLHPNPQSPFDGLRAGFVNASSGNLTFRRRDIVARAQGPVAFARVHDSRIAANADFGPGWRLSLAEELLADGDAVTHVDGSGARQGFAWGAAGYAASPPTPRHEGTRLTFQDVGGARVATLVDGEATRTFERAGGTGTRWAVRTVATRARTLEFAWEGGRLASVSHGGATLFEIDRDADGRIARVRDGHGRSVSYAYDADGRLETVRDLAGSDWNHRCRDDGLLVAAVDPEGRTCLAVEHDDAGRVARASADGRVHACAYGPDATAVTEGTGERHTLLRGASGVTVGVSSTTGASWTATLDASNRVSTLALPGRAVAYAYDGEGRVETVAETTPDGTTTTRSFEHDGRGRLVSATGGPDPVTVTYAGNGVHVLTGSEAFEYETDDRGRVVSVRRGGEPEIRVGRDRAGNVVEISQGHRNARFGRDELGRIADAAFADGSSVRYSHDELGNRTRAEYGGGVSVTYDHDITGIVGIRRTGGDGSAWCVSAGGQTDRLLVAGDAVAFHAGQSAVAVHHGRIGTVAALASASALLSGFVVGDGQPDYGVVAFGEGLGAAGRGPLDRRVVGFDRASALYEAIGVALETTVVDGVEQPSDGLFASVYADVVGFRHLTGTTETMEHERCCEPDSPPTSTTVGTSASGVSYQVRNHQHQTPTAVRWGQFYTDGLIGLDLEAKAYYVAASRVWKPKITAAVSRYDIWWGHTLSEASAANATASNCEQMIQDMTEGAAPQQYYSTESLRAHEYAHLADWETSLNKEFPSVVQAIEALSVAHSCGMGQSSAQNALTGLRGLKSARDAAFRGAATTYATYGHTNADPAGQAVKDRIIREIKAKGGQNASWPQACRD